MLPLVSDCSVRGMSDKSFLYHSVLSFPPPDILCIIIKHTHLCLIYSGHETSGGLILNWMHRQLLQFWQNRGTCSCLHFPGDNDTGFPCFSEHFMNILRQCSFLTMQTVIMCWRETGTPTEVCQVEGCEIHSQPPLCQSDYWSTEPSLIDGDVNGRFPPQSNLTTLVTVNTNTGKNYIFKHDHF